ncbi:hypothetical protein [Clostridium saccharobutylicum]|uniref:GIY-YIG domain-containing protein n=1 Tax=Clostridium saccharobutylicum TaxID=169679 RepID=A0A1S8MZE7_CLOSA|nr:hypothetical protein [Clostridium saccharobutylicum]OOM09431.1 hypothetical protein CLOSAC_37120 [Clostridium saccharobutylicum]
MENNNTNENHSVKWLHAKENIFIDEKILDWHNIVRGIYGIFIKCIGENKKCVYVGRSISIYDRMFNSENGHIAKMKEKEHFISELNKASEDSQIKVFIEILEEVDFEFDDYHKDMQRLASAENYYIDRYQSRNQSLNQVPEGTKMTKEEWEVRKNASYNL